MPYYTPLRYPGGKRRLVPLITSLIEENGLRNVQYVEPYAGGAAVALALLLEEQASTVHINDLSRAVYAFWYSAINDNPELCRRVERVKVTIREWKRQRAILQDAEQADLSTLGFAALFLNRTNRSGILSGGVIGGQGQTGEWALDARFNKDELLRRIRRIGRYASRIKLYQDDALAFTERVIPTLGANTFVFYDPPYIEKGDDLYLNEYDLDGHRRLSKAIERLKMPWVVTYDLAAVKASLFRRRRRIVYGLRYSAQDRYEGSEVMFLADRLKLPSRWKGRFELSADSSQHRVYGRVSHPTA